MSEASTAAEFEAAAAAAHEEEGEDLTVGQEVEAEEGGEEEAAPQPKNWEKIAQDKEAALAAERSRRKAADRARRELEERVAKMEASSKGVEKDDLAELLQGLREDDEDPISDINGLKAVVRRFLAEQKADRENEAQSTQQQRAVQSLINTMAEHEADFAADHPDYHDAAAHYRADRQAELEELGFTGQQLQQKLAQDLFGVVQTAIGAGKDPAEAVYKLAAKRGFKSEASAAADKLKKIADSAAAGRGAPAASPNKGPLSWSDVSKLKGAARDAAWAKLREQERRAG